MEYSKKLFGHGILFYPVMVAERRLSAPADMEGAVDMRLAPLHYPAQLAPILYIFKFHKFDRSSRYNKSVKLSLYHILKRLVKREQMFTARVLCLVCSSLEKSQFHL